LPDKDLNAGLKEGLEELAGDSEVDKNRVLDFCKAKDIEELINEKETLEKELSNLKEQYNALYNEAARVKADFYNYKRRMESNIEKQKNSIVAEIILNLLPIMDNFERALDCEVEKGSAFYEGTSMIYREFLNVLAKFGVTPIKAIGEPFDPLLHEAVAVQTVSDIDSDGKVVQEVQKGYTLKGEVIRPARVIVGKLNEETDKEVGNDE